MSFVSLRRALGALSFAALAAGCASNQSTPTRPAPTATPSVAPAPSASPSLTPTPTPTPSPTPLSSNAPPASAAPTVTPTATPTSPITITYSAQSVYSVTLPGPNNGCTQAADFTDTFTASEAGVTSFTAVSSNPAQVTVAPQSGSTSAFVATEPRANSNYASTTIVVSDPAGNTANAVINFTVTCLNGFARKRADLHHGS